MGTGVGTGLGRSGALPIVEFLRTLRNQFVTGISVTFT